RPRRVHRRRAAARHGVLRPLVHGRGAPSARAGSARPRRRPRGPPTRGAQTMRKEHDRRAGHKARHDADHPAPGSCSCPPRPDDVHYGAWRVPRPSACDVEEARVYGDDVCELDAIAIEAELMAATQALATLPARAHVAARAWLLDRRRRLIAAIERNVERFHPPLPTETPRPSAHTR